MKIEKRGQVWIETVLYTLIGMALIGVVLAFVTPKINEQKDRLLVEQTLQALDIIDQKVSAVLQAPGNVRQLDFAMKKGSFYVNSTSDSIVFVIDELNKPYSEPGVEISVGKIKYKTTKNQNDYSIRLETQYSEDILYNLKNENRKFDSVAIPYKFSVSNEGVQSNGRTAISLNEISGAQ